MSRWGWGGKPDWGAMRSLFHTRNAPQCTRLGSRYSAKLKWKLALSQPWSDLPSFSNGLRSIMALPLGAKMAPQGTQSSFGLVSASRGGSAALAPPGAADGHQEGERHEDAGQQRQLVDAGHGVALVAAQPDPVRAAGGAARPHRADLGVGLVA